MKDSDDQTADRSNVEATGSDRRKRQSRKIQWRNHHRMMLAICGAVVVLSFALRVKPDQRVEFFFLPGSPLPESCMSRTLFHTDCPGCGLTRSFIHLAAGRTGQSWSTNRVGWLLAIAVLLQFPYRIAALKSVAADQPPPFWKWHATFSGVLIVALVGNWLFNITGH
jgi:hypothetical protein